MIDLLARAGAGFDIVSGGELAAGAGSRRRPGQGRLLRRRQERGRDPSWRSSAGVRCFNVESRSELQRLDASRRRTGLPGSGVAARESGRRRRHAPVHLDRAAREQVRHRARSGARRSTAKRRACRASRSSASTATSARRSPNWHRSSRHWTRCSNSSERSRARASRSRTSTWAAGWAFATATSGRRRATAMLAAMFERIDANPRRRDLRADVRVRPLDRRQRGRAAHARRVPEANAGQALRDRRRGDERPDAPGAVRRLSRRSCRSGAARSAASQLRRRRSGVRVG